MNEKNRTKTPRMDMDNYNQNQWRRKQQKP